MSKKIYTLKDKYRGLIITKPASVYNDNTSFTFDTMRTSEFDYENICNSGLGFKEFFDVVEVKEEPVCKSDIGALDKVILFKKKKKAPTKRKKK